MKTALRCVPTLAASALALLAFAACGPSSGGGDDDVIGDCTNPVDEVCHDGEDNDCDGVADCDDADDCATADACRSCIPVAEVCDDTVDNDCDNIIDCEDADCEGHPVCPASTCGTLQTPEGMLALPDSTCSEDETIPCPGYENTLDFSGFSAGQTLTDINKLLGICVNMEHSWMRDIVIYATCPNGTKVMLHDFAGRTGGEVYLGEPNDFDSGANPIPGVGYDYCWTPTATNPSWIDYANQTNAHTIPAGDYQSSESLNAFLGCPLNGGWTIRVEDRWAIDNGYIFKWSVRFDPSIVEDCENWPD
jgi:hypothetical protein